MTRRERRLEGVGELTPDRLAELRQPTTCLALLDRIEALVAFAQAEKAVREHGRTCVYLERKPGACPGGVCMELLRAREAAYQRALATINPEKGGGDDGR